MSKLLAGVIAALLVGVGVAAASSLTAADDDPIRTGTVSTLDSTGTTGTTERTGTTETNGTTTTTETGSGTTETGEDVSGPCDEAEHANDPRCTGAATTNDDRGRDGDRGRNRGRDDDGGDHSGRGGGGDRHEDRSGSNAGKG